MVGRGVGRNWSFTDSATARKPYLDDGFFVGGQVKSATDNGVLKVDVNGWVEKESVVLVDWQIVEVVSDFNFGNIGAFNTSQAINFFLVEGDNSVVIATKETKDDFFNEGFFARVVWVFCQMVARDKTIFFFLIADKFIWSRANGF